MPHELLLLRPFPFADGRFPPDLGAIAHWTVARCERPALEVYHDHDNYWLVLDGVTDPLAPDSTIVDALTHLSADDPTLAGLATLPPGHVATRRHPTDPWRIAEMEPEDDPA